MFPYFWVSKKANLIVYKVPLWKLPADVARRKHLLQEVDAAKRKNMEAVEVEQL